ncbi:MAG: DUF262 domain-containing protein [Candidatus Methanoperedens sp.]
MVLPEDEDKPFVEEKFADKETDDEELEIPQTSPKDRKLVTHPYDFIVRSLDQQIKDGTLILADKYQRRRVWQLSQCSKLIESLLMNVPIPICYFAEIDQGRYSVIDGQQRLSSIHRFLNNEYYLRGLKVRSDLNDKRYHQIGIEDQRLIMSRTLRCIVVLKESDPIIRFDVFERLNTNSTKLSTQELRNCVFRGDMNDLCKELSEDTNFLYLRNVKEPDLRMRDIELVLRFFAFYENIPEYKGNLKLFLDTYQSDGAKLNPDKKAELKKIFIRVIDDVKTVFGNEAFRKYDSVNSSWEKSVNRAIYDSIMLCFANSESNILKEKKSEIIQTLKELCLATEFKEAISSSTKDRSKVKLRLTLFRDALINRGIPVKEIQFWRE